MIQTILVVLLLMENSSEKKNRQDDDIDEIGKDDLQDLNDVDLEKIFMFGYTEIEKNA